MQPNLTYCIGANKRNNAVVTITDQNNSNQFNVLPPYMPFPPVNSILIERIN